MFSQLKKINREDIATFGIVVIMVSLLLSRFVLSIGMIILILNALLFSPSLRNDFNKFIADKNFAVITSLFFICLLSGIFSNDFSYFSERMRIKLPFLLLPFAFSVLKPFSEKRFYLLLLFYLFTITVASIGVMVNYFLHYEIFTDLYKKAHVMPTPIGHIHFSLMVAFAILVGTHLFLEKKYFKFPFERIAILVFTLFLIIFIHLLAVRSGLVAFYISLCGYILWKGFSEKKIMLSLLILFTFFSISYLAYKYIPTLNNKIHYALYDLEMYKSGAEPSGFSDGGRFYSYKVGWEIAKKNLLFGVGYGNLQNEINKTYETLYPQINAERRLFPHNQFLFFFSAMGIVGLLYLIFVFLFPILYRQQFRNILFLCFHLIILTAFMVESYIEDQIGTAFYLLFLLLLLNQTRSKQLPA